jgi:hypothetical protein
MRVGALLQRSARVQVLMTNGGFLALVVSTGTGMGLVAVSFQELLRASNQLFFGSFPSTDLTAPPFNPMAATRGY